MSKVKSIALNSANVRYSNVVDEQRTFDIESNVNLQGGNVVSMDGGIVKKEDAHICSFSKYGNNQLNVNFSNVSVMDMCAALNAITEFENDVKAAVAETVISI